MSASEWEKRKRRLDRQRRLEESDERGGRGVTPNPFYHRYFAGYSEKYVLGPNGRKTISRVYVGQYYTRACGDTAWVLVKLAYVLMFLAACASILLAMSYPAPCNSLWYTTVPGFLALLAAVLLGVSVFTCAFAPRSMKMYNYSLFTRLPKQCLRCAVPVAVYIAAVVVYGLLQSQPAGSFLPAVCAVPAVLLLTLLALVEKKAQYNAAGGSEPDRDGVVIT